MPRSSRSVVLWISAILLSSCGSARSLAGPPESTKKKAPRIIIGITIDQMRNDFLDKFRDDFGNDGFNKICNEGHRVQQVFYNYAPTYTGPGHASIFTGTTPAFHGIVANDWYDRFNKKMIYCASDSERVSIGSVGNAGKMSPTHLRSTTIADELELFTNRRSKTIGISMKDRGAILPAGRTADCAYWFSGGDEGKWITSDWYLNDLPEWVKKFNARRSADSLLNLTWNLLRNEKFYDESSNDNSPYELPFKGQIKPVFPYNLAELRKSNLNYDLLKATPFGNDFTLDFAMAAIEGEQLGEDDITDMLCLSFSSTDFIGHQFGTQSMELQDCYLRLDAALARFILFLDHKIGRDNYLLFISADHGAANNPGYLQERKGASGYWKSDLIENCAETFLDSIYGKEDWVEMEVNQNIYLNHDLIRAKHLDLEEVQYNLLHHIEKMKEIWMAFAGTDLDRMIVRSGLVNRIQLGYKTGLSGDVIYMLPSGFIEYGMQGTTHGSVYNYDAHVPALFFGYGIKTGETSQVYDITDLAPTVCSIVRIPVPSASIGKVITSVAQP